MKDLSGRVALLTGASGGLGPYIARRLREEGVNLVLSGRNREALDRLAVEVGGRVEVADLGDRAAAIELAERCADIDILVANAGVIPAGSLDSMDVEDIDQALDVNVRAPMVLAKLLLRRMKERREGHIVLMASIGGRMAGADYPVYCATKYALRGLGLALRMDLESSGVGVSIVSPTYVNEAGMWAITGQKAHRIAGDVSPERVAEAVVKAIRSNRVEVNVMALMGSLGVRFAQAVPELAVLVAQRTGSGRVPAAAVERQRDYSRSRR